jgi:hypothetical protein
VLLLHALKKVQTTDDPERSRVAAGEAFVAGKVFAKDGAPPEVDVLRVLGRACHQVGLWTREQIAEQLREAFKAGQWRGSEECT